MQLEGSVVVGIETDGTWYVAIAGLFRVVSFPDSARNLSDLGSFNFERGPYIPRSWYKVME